MGQRVFKLRFLKLITLVVVYFIFSACQDDYKVDEQTKSYLKNFKKDSLRILEFYPSQKIEDRHQFILIRFNQPVAPLSTVGKPLKSVKFVDISPKIKGRYIWMHPQTLMFSPESSWERHTDYRVTIYSGWESLLGIGFLEPQTFSLKTKKKLGFSRLFMSLKNLNSYPELFVNTPHPKPKRAKNILGPHLPFWIGVDLSSFLRINDKTYGEIKVSNLTKKTQTFKIILKPSLLSTGFSEQIILAPHSDEFFQIDFWFSKDLEEKLFNTWLEDPKKNFLEVPLEIVIEQNDQVVQSQKINLPIYSHKSLQKQKYSGVIHSVKKKNILKGHTHDFELGEVDIQFSLQAQDWIKARINGLRNSVENQTIVGRAQSLLPYVLFPKFTVTLGSNQKEWKEKFQKVDNVLNDLRKLQQPHGGFSNSEETLVLAEFIGFARLAGFSVNDLAKGLKSRLMYFLEKETIASEQIKILSILSLFDWDQLEIYNALLKKWSDLDEISQMQLAALVLKMNPLHDIQKKVRRSVDRSLSNDSNLSTQYWFSAFVALLYSNPADELTFEVFSEIFNQDFSNSYEDDVLALKAFQKYLNRLDSKNEEILLTMFLDDHSVMKSSLNREQPFDVLKIPFTKLPKTFDLTARKEKGSLAFYNIEVSGVKKTKPINPFENGVSLSHFCYDYKNPDQIVSREFKFEKTYMCLLSIYVDEKAHDVELTLPLSPGEYTTSEMFRPKQEFLTSINRTLTSYQAKASELSPGLYLFTYKQLFRQLGKYSLPPIVLKSAKNPNWGAVYEQNSIKISNH